jgi:hypothetical protein
MFRGRPPAIAGLFFVLLKATTQILFQARNSLEWRRSWLHLDLNTDCQQEEVRRLLAVEAPHDHALRRTRILVRRGDVNSTRSGSSNPMIAISSRTRRPDARHLEIAPIARCGWAGLLRMRRIAGHPSFDELKIVFKG